MAFIHHIVVQQRRGVNELDRSGKLDVVRARVAKHPRGRERQHRTQPLAAGFDKMGCHFRDARRVLAGHPFADQKVHRLQIICQNLGQSVRCRLFRRSVGVVLARSVHACPAPLHPRRRRG